MRKILFRGKRIYNGEWVEGFYVCLYDRKDNVSHRIYKGYAESDCGDFYPDWWEVDPNTVGQYIGLEDVNDRKIFEGDIISKYDARGRFVAKAAVVTWDDFFLEFTGKVPTFEGIGIYKDDSCFNYRIIGNIYDSPELLEGCG